MMDYTKIQIWWKGSFPVKAKKKKKVKDWQKLQNIKKKKTTKFVSFLKSVIYFISQSMKYSLSPSILYLQFCILFSGDFQNIYAIDLHYLGLLLVKRESS